MSSIKKHWDNVYNTKAETGVSWFLLYPKTSMEFVKEFQLPVTANIIDIGGGNSRFVDALLNSIKTFGCWIYRWQQLKKPLSSYACRSFNPAG